MATKATKAKWAEGEAERVHGRLAVDATVDAVAGVRYARATSYLEADKRKLARVVRAAVAAGWMTLDEDEPGRYYANPACVNVRPLAPADIGRACVIGIEGTPVGVLQYTALSPAVALWACTSPTTRFFFVLDFGRRGDDLADCFVYTGSRVIEFQAGHLAEALEAADKARKEGQTWMDISKIWISTPEINAVALAKAQEHARALHAADVRARAVANFVWAVEEILGCSAEVAQQVKLGAALPFGHTIEKPQAEESIGHYWARTVAAARTRVNQKINELTRQAVALERVCNAAVQLGGWEKVGESMVAAVEKAIEKEAQK